MKRSHKFNIFLLSHIRKKIIWFAVCLSLHFTNVLGGELFPYTVSEQVLENGLKIIAIPFPSSNVISFTTIVRVGARDQSTTGISGFAHFFEHMMFKGTPNISVEAYNFVLKKYGIENTASTWDDRTVFSNVFAKDALESVVRIESDRFKNLSYTKESYQKETSAIYSEYLKNLTNPSYSIYRKMQETAFTIHPYRYTTFGLETDLKKLPQYYEYSKEFYNQYYRPDNTVILIMGDIEPNNIFNLITQYYSDWEKGFTPNQTPQEPEQENERKVHIDWSNNIQPYLAIGIKTDAFSKMTIKEYAALDFLTQILFSNQSPFYKKMVLQLNRVTSISNDFTPHRDPFLWISILHLTNSDHTRSVLKDIFDTLTELTGRPVNDLYFSDLKSNWLNTMTLNLTKLKYTSQVLTEMIGATGSSQPFIDYLNAYRNLTPADISKVAKKYLDSPQRTIVTLDSIGTIK